MENKELLNIHAVITSSAMNGPGRRMVVFLQGCRRSCPGCFNPDTHSLENRNLFSPEQVFGRFFKPAVEGLTVSGGEPFEQPRGLYLLLKEARSRGLSTVVYTGYTLEELKEKEGAEDALQLIDVLIDGPYRDEMKEKTLLARGSSNQRLHFLTDRYALSDFLMPGRLEVIIGADGTVVETGFSRVNIP